jgi:HEAT repeat protein
MLAEKHPQFLVLPKQESSLVESYILAAKIHINPWDVSVVESLVKLLSHEEIEVREVAAYGLTSCRAVPEPRVKDLNRALGDESAWVRNWICEVLLVVDAKYAPLMTNLPRCLADCNEHVRRGAALAVGKLRMKKNVADLIKLFEDPDELVPTMALQGLNYMGDDSAHVLEAIRGAERRGRLDPEDVAIVLEQLGRRKEKRR